MNKKGLIIFIVLLVLYCVIGSVAYYRKVVNGTITGNSGKAVFNVSGFTEVNQSKIITLKDGAIVPGDKGSFDLVMDASGSSVDMYASLRIERTSLPENLKFYTSSDYKSELHTYYSYLKKGSETLTIYWYWNPYIDDAKDSEFINSNNTENLSASIMINAVQVSVNSVMKNGYSAKTEFWSDTYRPYIESISFEKNTGNVPSTCDISNLCFDVSDNASLKKVYAYLKSSGNSDASGNALYNLYIASDAPIFAPINCSNMFGDFASLKTIDFNGNFNTSNVTNMSYMFTKNSSLVSLDLNSFNTVNVSTMGGMFENCSLLQNLYINNFNTSRLSGMWFMFARCSALTTLDLSSFDTSKATSTSNMFNGCASLVTLDLSNFNTSNMTSMTAMFANCSSLASLDLSGFNTSKVTNMSNMFSQCKVLTKLNLNNFNTSNVTNMNSMFYNCKTITDLDLSNFNTVNVTNMSTMFTSCSGLKNLNIINFNTTNVMHTASMFAGCTNINTSINILNSTNTDYTGMFSNAATDANAKITVNYIADASTLVDNMIATKSSNSNVVKGNQI